MVLLPEDAPPKKLYSIPSGEEVEFPRWELFRKSEGAISGGFLYTHDNAKFWMDPAATRWLEAAEKEGKSPADTLFIVKHVQEGSDHCLRYGFKAKEESGRKARKAPVAKKQKVEEDIDEIVSASESEKDEEDMVLDDNTNSGNDEEN